MVQSYEKISKCASKNGINFMKNKQKMNKKVADTIEKVTDNRLSN